MEMKDLLGPSFANFNRILKKTGMYFLLKIIRRYFLSPISNVILGENYLLF